MSGGAHVATGSQKSAAGDARGQGGAGWQEGGGEGAVEGVGDWAGEGAGEGASEGNGEGVVVHTARVGSGGGGVIWPSS